mmetsp:Transcript_19375/g.42297  ORF Transcript_19375/g.42297 Transcript_19375/m.42297 type:complete len:311 (+) Transcript_19375:218-1150(+)
MSPLSTAEPSSVGCVPCGRRRSLTKRPLREPKSRIVARPSLSKSREAWRLDTAWECGMQTSQAGLLPMMFLSRGIATISSSPPLRTAKASSLTDGGGGGEACALDINRGTCVLSMATSSSLAEDLAGGTSSRSFLKVPTISATLLERLSWPCRRAATASLAAWFSRWLSALKRAHFSWPDLCCSSSTCCSWMLQSTSSTRLARASWEALRSSSAAEVERSSCCISARTWMHSRWPDRSISMSAACSDSCLWWQSPCSSSLATADRKCSKSFSMSATLRTCASPCSMAPVVATCCSCRATCTRCHCRCCSS